jgi:hypothetical protein
VAASIAQQALGLRNMTNFERKKEMMALDAN